MSTLFNISDNGDVEVAGKVKAHAFVGDGLDVGGKVEAKGLSFGKFTTIDPLWAITSSLAS